jgi:hypothetical protein
MRLAWIALSLVIVVATTAFVPPAPANHARWHACVADHGSLNAKLDVGFRFGQLEGDIAVAQYSIDLLAGERFRAWFSSTNFSYVYHMMLHSPTCQFLCFKEFVAALVAELDCTVQESGRYTVMLASYSEGNYHFLYKIE